MIRIWAPSESADPIRHNSMLKLTGREGLAAFLRANRIADADIMPPYRRGAYLPDEEDQFEIFVTQEDVEGLSAHVEGSDIARFIWDKAGLLGSVQLPFGAPLRYADHRQVRGLELLCSLS